MSVPPEQGEPRRDLTAMTQDARRERLRFADFVFARTPDGRCHAEVSLEWIDEVRVRGQASGLSSEIVDLRVAAEATLRALEAFTDGAVGFELTGVKSVRAFDASVIIVSIVSKADGTPRRLLGVCLVETNPVRGAALAVLNATNRVLGNFVSTR